MTHRKRDIPDPIGTFKIAEVIKMLEELQKAPKSKKR